MDHLKRTHPSPSPALSLPSGPELAMEGVAGEKQRRKDRPASWPQRQRQPPTFWLMWIGCLVLFTSSWIQPVQAYTNGTLTPISGDDNTVILDVGQKIKISSQNWALGITLMVFGLVQVFWGFKFLRFTLFVTGFLSWAAAAQMIMVAIRWDLVYTTFLPKYYYFWVWLFSGLLGATLSFRYWDLGVTITGAFGGFTVAMFIIAFANLSIANAFRYVLLALLILAGAALATFYERVFIILGTSFGGAFMTMFGLDEFLQTGYREMIVIFDFTGKTLVYHPNRNVYLMLGGSLLLAGLGIGWEFWHHEKPLWLDRKAVFRIYGRPFGKRPHKLVGQRIKHKLRKMSWYTYLAGCLCLRRKSVEEVLYEDEEEGCECPQDIGPPNVIVTDPPQEQTPMDSAHLVQGDQTVVVIPTQEPSEKSASEEKVVPAESEALRTAPMHVEELHQEGEEGETFEFVITTEEFADTGSSKTSTVKTVRTAGRPSIAQTTTTTTTTSRTADQGSTTTTTIETTSTPTETPSTTTTIPSAEPIPSSITENPLSTTPQHHHPLFSPHLGQRTMNMIRMVVDDTSPGNTIPRTFQTPDRHSPRHPNQPQQQHQQTLQEEHHSSSSTSSTHISTSSSTAITRSSSDQTSHPRPPPNPRPSSNPDNPAS